MKTKGMKKLSKALAIFMTVFMLMGMMPQAAFANTVDTTEKTGTSYISISFDGQFIRDKNDEPVAYIPVDIEKLREVDLAKYNLEDYSYDADDDGENEITAVHMYIYVHETILGKSWDEVSVSGGVGSIFFESGLFGFEDCNLNYYFNGEYPAVDGWGVTADQLVIEDGDFVDIAGYTSWSFYSDSAFGFHFFSGEEGEFTHEYTAETGTEKTVKLVRSASVMGSGMTVTDVSGYTVYYGKTLGKAEGCVETDSTGAADIVFPSAGTWYVWCEGGYGIEDPESIVSSPTSAVVTVTGNSSPESDAEAVAKALTEAKTAAKKDIAAYKAADSYRDAQKEELAEAIKAANKAIDAAVDKESVDAAVAAAKTSIDKIKTDAQLDKEEAEAKEAKDKAAAKKVAAALVKPAKVTTKLRTVSGGYDDVVFSWSKVKGASGYYVYYKNAKAKSYTKIATTAGTSVTKKNLADGAKYYFKVIPYAKVGKYSYPATTYKTSSIYTLKKISTPKVTKSGSKVKVRWTNINGETGYQISKATKKSGTKIAATYKTTTGKSKLIKATKGKKYYYKVRAYKVVDGKKVYGPWSDIKSYKR